MGSPPPPALARHDQHAELARLADDVYASAAGTGQAPPGWLRASENLQALKAAYPDLEGRLGDQQLSELFSPTELGVRAELYLPDPAAQPPGTAPVLAFKGTNGAIRVQDPAAPGGVRVVESSISDWANNLIQGTGGEAPDYTHAMAMARRLQDAGVDFIATGHSKGGGLATAVASVTGAEAVVFNPAGLHPETTARFLRGDAGATPGDPARLVTVYRVEGEVLNAGAQDFTEGMSDRRRNQLADVLQEVARTATVVPGFDRQIAEALETAGVDRLTAQRTLDTIDRIGSPEARGLLDRFPTAAGRIEPTLRAMERGPGGELLAREAPTLPETAPALAPVLGALHDIAAAAKGGRSAGELTERGVAVAARGVDGAGDAMRSGAEVGASIVDRGARGAGEATGVVVRGGGETLATGRQVASEVRGAAVEGGGLALSGFQRIGAERARELAAIPFLPDYAQRFLTRSAEALEEQADNTLAESQRRALGIRDRAREDAVAIREGAGRLATTATDAVARSTDGVERALRDAGAGVDRRLEGTAEGLREGAAYLPAAGAGAAALAETLRQSAAHPSLPGYAVFVLKHAQDAAGESVHRHGMGVVIDSLEGRRREIEAAERERIEREHGENRRNERAPGPRDPADAAHPRHAMFRSIETGVHAIDTGLGRAPDASSRNLSYALYAEAATSGWSDVGGIVRGQKTAGSAAGEQTFAYRGVPERADDWISVRTAQAVQTSPEASLARVEQAELAAQREASLRPSIEVARAPMLP